MEDATGVTDIVGLSAEELVEGSTGEKISAIISSHQSRALVVAPHRG